MAEDRQALLVRQQLGVAVTGWQTSGRDRADLYRGARLVAAQDWAGGRTDLTPDERAFLRASERERRRRTRRLQGLVAVLATLLTGALIAGTLAVIARNEAEQGRQDALSRQLAAEAQAEADVDPVGAMRKAVESWQASPTTEARGALLSAPLITYPAAFSAGLPNVSSVDVGPDGRLIAVGSGEGKIVLWDTETCKPLDTEITATGLVSSVRFSPDGTLLATSVLDGNVSNGGVRIWDVATGRPVARLGSATSPAIGQVTWRPDGRAVAALSTEQNDTQGIIEWDARTGKPIRTLAKGIVDSLSIAYDTTGDRLAVGRSDGSVELWDTATTTRISRHTEHADTTTVRGPNGVIPVQVTFSGTLLASSSLVDNMIRLWNPRTGEPVRAFRDLTRQAGSAVAPGPTSLAFTADGRNLYTNSDINSITAWDPVTGNFLGNLAQGPRAGTTTGRTVVAIAISRDGRTRVAANSDGTVQRWHTNTSWYNPPRGSVMSLAFRPGGNEITAGDAEDGLYTWDSTSGAEISRAAVPGGALSLAYTADGTLITGWANSTFTLFPPEPGAKPRTIALPGRLFVGRGAMTVSPDGRWIAVAHQPEEVTRRGQDFKINVWDTKTLTERAVFGMDRQWPISLTFSPDGSRLLALISSGGLGVAGSDPDGDTAASVVTWRTPGFDGETRTALGSDTINSLVYTPDGKSVITAGNSGTIQIRDADTGQIREEFGRHTSMVRRIAISPDGRTLASVTTEDSTIRLWDLADPGHAPSRISTATRHPSTTSCSRRTAPGWPAAARTPTSRCGAWNRPTPSARCARTSSTRPRTTWATPAAADTRAAMSSSARILIGRIGCEGRHVSGHGARERSAPSAVRVR